MRLIALLLFLLPHAQGATWVANKDHSEIHFKVPYMGVSEVSGRFNDFSAQVKVNENGTLAGPLSVIIKASSIDTGNKMRDNHLRADDFLKTNKHPDIIFESKDLKVVSPQNYESSGTLTIKGITRPTTLTFTVSEAIKDTWGLESRFVRFQAKINRKDFAINWNKTLNGQEFLLGDQVSYQGIFQMQLERAKTANSKHMIPDNPSIRTMDTERQKPDSSFNRKLRNLINGKKIDE